MVGHRECRYRGEGIGRGEGERGTDCRRVGGMYNSLGPCGEYFLQLAGGGALVGGHVGLPPYFSLQLGSPDHQ